MSAQRRTATKQRQSASKTDRTARVAAPAADKPSTNGSARPPKPAAPKEVAASKQQSTLSLRKERLQNLIRDTWSEIKKITWPDSQTVRNLTALVLVMSTVLGLLLGGIDYVLLRVFDALS